MSLPPLLSITPELRQICDKQRSFQWRVDTVTTRSPGRLLFVACRSNGTCYNCCDVRVRLKYALPLAQMALAFALIWLSRRELAAAHIHAGRTPAFDLLALINPPAAILRGSWFNYVDYPWSDALFVASIGVFWYLFGLSIDYWRKRKTVLLFTCNPLRVTVDLALIALGPYFIWVLKRVDVADMPWQWEVPALATVFCWLLGPAFIFGRDLIHCLRRKASPPATSP
jgi:hypothetical protein